MSYSLHLYGRLILIALRSRMQYPASFVMQLAGTALLTGTEFVAVWALFARFGTLAGWRLEEVCLFYGMSNLGYALAECLGEGFDKFAQQVRKGDFDRLLLRPCSTSMQVAGSGMDPMRLGRLVQGGAVLAYAAVSLGGAWDWLEIGLIIGCILSGACVFVGLLVLQATLCFWTIESLEIANVLTHGGNEAAQFPFDIYGPGLRRFFTFVVPLACVNILPGAVLLERGPTLGIPAWASWGAPLMGPLFFLISLRVWEFGVRRYRSTGT